MLRLAQEALTFDDVLLLPAHSNVLPNNAKLNTYLTREIELKIPLVSAAMDTVTEAELAIALAQEGGMGFIHKNMSIAEQACTRAPRKEIMKARTGVVNQSRLTPNTTLQQVERRWRTHEAHPASMVFRLFVD